MEPRPGDAVVGCGLDLLLEAPDLLRGKSWGLLSNQASVTSGLELARLALWRASGAKPALLLAPEHGIDGVAQDMEAVGDEVDPLTGCRVVSLYGDSEASLKPASELLSALDLLLVDLPDIGTRHYTFAATMVLALEVCADIGLPVVVLDRPNPLGGLVVQGGVVRDGFFSFVSALPMPIRHGFTLGEIALWVAKEKLPELKLSVVTCRGWERGMMFPDTGLVWVAPSPNMPTWETAALYPGLCFIEATNVSEGRGTTRPFKLVGAPWVDPEVLARELGSVPVEGFAVRPARFRPEFGKHAGVVCGGVELFVVDPLSLNAVELGAWLVWLLANLWPDEFRWRSAPYEFVSEVPAIDLLTGSGIFREAVERGTGIEEVLEVWRSEAESWRAEAADLWLYR